jgi:YD repeat-containing protein
VVTRTDADGETTWTYDLGHIGALSATLSPDGHEELFEHDGFGRIESSTKIIAGEMFELGYAYDGFDRLAEIHYPQAQDTAPFWVRHEYADNGQLRAVHSGPDDALLWRVEDLDERGHVIEEHFGNDAVGRRTYDPLRGFIKTIETVSDLGGVPQSLAYQWNHDGTLERRADTRPGRSEQHETFEYDALDRVTAVHTQSGGQSHDRHFAYDPLGNLVFATDRGEYDYDLDGRLALADGSSYTWDDNGNLLARTGARPVSLSYTAFDKPTELDLDQALRKCRSSEST